MQQGKAGQKPLSLFSVTREKTMLPEQAYHRHSDLSDSSMHTISTTTSISSTTTTTVTDYSTCLRCLQKMKEESHKQQKQKQPLGIQDFRILKPIGAGDIGKVYLCQLIKTDDDGNVGESEKTNNYYAIKVMDKDVLELKKKTHRAQTEKETLKLLHHPFLPKLVANFDASSRFSCNVIDYCSGGDLHYLRHRQPNNRFSLSSARFYAAEVLMALEYLHMLGIVYRDLKPENILVRSDGHIMLTDFDLCLRSSSTPTIQDECNRSPASSSSSSCIPRYFRKRKLETLASSTPYFVAEPTSARSSSFVGTHEYVAPEVASGNPHGSAVDWWAFGIFIYEMLYGRTPFAGESNEITLRNIVKTTLAFPSNNNKSDSYSMSLGEVRARDLIVRLLNKDVASRLGSKKGAAEIKCHAFFKGLNFALIRWSTPPEIPDNGNNTAATGSSSSSRRDARATSAAFDCF